MNNVDLQRIFSLLTRAKDTDVKITLVGDELLVKYPRSKPVDAALLSELKRNKEDLLTYLRSQVSAKVEVDRRELKCVRRGGDLFYPITPVEVYWVNQEKDRAYKVNEEEHGASFVRFEVRGAFRIDVFRRSVQFLIERHESLRSTFHYIDGKYLLKVLDPLSPVFNVEYIDACQAGDSTALIGEYVDYKGQRFNLSEGPLFRSRVIRTAESAFIVSMKVHHVILDTWAEEIMLRDLLTAYRAFIEGVVPKLAPLEYQLKDYLAFANDHTHANCAADKKFWEESFHTLPKELVIPCAHVGSTPMDQKIRQAEMFELQPELVDKMNGLARELGISLFVIIQAAFKLYLMHETRQSDIVIGTFVFGRTYPGTEDQIGCYARTVLIRTVLNPTDSLRDAILKVRRANDDMQQRSAYSLMERLEALLPPGENIYGTFWKINLQFNDMHRGYLDACGTWQPSAEDDVQLIPIPETGNRFIAIDMELEFLHFNKNLELRVCYDSSLYSVVALRTFIGRFLHYAMSIQ